MAYEAFQYDAIPLWPAGAPGARGTAEADTPALTPFRPNAPQTVAAVVVCPGGGYCKLADHEGGPIARWLCAMGIAAFVLRYRVAPYRHPIPLMDVQRALRLVRARCGQYRVDPGRVGVLGFSAGGHLACSAATMFDAGKPDPADEIDRHPCRPDAAVLCYPVISSGRYAHKGSFANLLGDRPTPELLEEVSLENRVSSEMPPTFLWHTAEDQVVPVQNSLLLADAMRQANVPFSLHVFPHGTHGLGLAARTPLVWEWPKLCTDWLQAVGFGA